MKIIIIIALGIATFMAVLCLLCVLAILAYQGITYVWDAILDFGYYMFKTMASDIRTIFARLKERKEAELVDNNESCLSDVQVDKIIEYLRWENLL
ncbi:hypothetical protein [Holdemanella biformis]|uniref:hypothetical protein n=1 Tax=Holdemanella biformis TaxID=1735 RepID=UPI00267384FE|nr:hypothetical protein [Holdemanella biformis]MEE0474026.1 hypothetical protein [Holdemanella biformis]